MGGTFVRGLPAAAIYSGSLSIGLCVEH